MWCCFGDACVASISKMQRQSCGGGSTIQFLVGAGSCWMAYSGSDKRLHGFIRISLLGRLDELVKLRCCYSCTDLVARARKDFSSI